MEEEQNYNCTNTLTDEALSLLSSAHDNLKGLLQGIVQSHDNFNITADFNRLNENLDFLRKNIEYLTGPFIEDKKKDMATTLEELEVIRTKYRNLQKEWENQQEHLGRLQGDMFKMRAQLKNQSSFCASLGAIMGSLMWKTSRLSNVVDVLLSTNRVSEFLCIVSGSLESFMETYKLSMPDVTTNEMQFILSLVGIVANMAASGDGRQFLVTDPNGRELVHQLVAILPNIPNVSGDCLKRVVLMSLYNVSINQLGLIMLLDNTELFQELSKCVKGETNPELQLLSLRLLQSLTMQIPSSEVYYNVMLELPVANIQELTNATDADMRLLAQSILSNTQRAGAKFGSQPDKELPSFSEYNRCRHPPPSSADNSSCSAFSSVQ